MVGTWDWLLISAQCQGYEWCLAKGALRNICILNISWNVTTSPLLCCNHAGIYNPKFEAPCFTQWNEHLINQTEQRKQFKAFEKPWIPESLPRCTVSSNGPLVLHHISPLDQCCMSSTNMPLWFHETTYQWLVRVMLISREVGNINSYDRKYPGHIYYMARKLNSTHS